MGPIQRETTLSAGESVSSLRQLAVGFALTDRVSAHTTGTMT
jgi:hypothetical protein